LLLCRAIDCGDWHSAEYRNLSAVNGCSMLIHQKERTVPKGFFSEPKLAILDLLCTIFKVDFHTLEISKKY
jgi:hypothetical protein